MDHDKIDDNVHNQRLMSMGILMSSLLHEISTPVTYIKGNIEFVQKIIYDLFIYLEKNSLLKDDDYIDSQKFSDIKSHIEKIFSIMSSGIEKSFDIISIYRDYLKKDKKEINEYDVASLIDNSLNLILSTVNPLIKIEKKYDVTANVRVNKNKFTQIIVNLVLNAIQAINESGIVTISVKADEESVFITVKDTGKGISKPNLDKLFTPFFTTKNDGNMGMGLYISSVIIKEFGGKITVESEENVGSSFIISLPLCKKA